MLLNKNEMIRFLLKQFFVGILFIFLVVLRAYFLNKSMLLGWSSSIGYLVLVFMPPFMIFGVIYFFLVKFFNKEHSLIVSIRITSIVLLLFIVLAIATSSSNRGVTETVDFGKIFVYLVIYFAVGIAYTVLFHKWLYPKRIQETRSKGTVVDILDE